jgi:malonate-semialdehyde dehydrogenase (acetylating) / methylmalonate-semialdehyde dehydrogenase
VSLTSQSAAVRTLNQFVAGGWVASDAVQTIDVTNPATGATLARVPAGTAADVDRAVTAARAAQKDWATTPPQVRARALYRLRDILDTHRDELVS